MRLRKSDGWSVARVAHADAADMVCRMHYSGGCSNTSVLAAGLMNADHEMMGAAVWMPPAPGAAKWAAKRFGCDSSKVITLSRMVIHDTVPRNGASFIIGWSVKELRRMGWRVGVTYADPLEGHTGLVYLACNWARVGSSAATPRWTDADGLMRSRHCVRGLTVAEMLQRGWSKTKGEPKPRYTLKF